MASAVATEEALTHAHRAELQSWLEERLPAIVAAALEEEDAPEACVLPVICDFSLCFAWEDASDADAPTHYSTISSYVPTYRLLGLLRACAARFDGPRAPREET
jgi:hypothetical protein